MPKIDRSFAVDALVLAAGHAAGQRAIARLIVQLGQATGVLMLAEGVETSGSSASASRLCGCPSAALQGYLLGPAARGESCCASACA